MIRVPAFLLSLFAIRYSRGATHDTNEKKRYETNPFAIRAEQKPATLMPGSTLIDPDRTTRRRDARSIRFPDRFIYAHARRYFLPPFFIGPLRAEVRTFDFFPALGLLLAFDGRLAFDVRLALPVAARGLDFVVVARVAWAAARRATGTR